MDNTSQNPPTDSWNHPDSYIDPSREPKPLRLWYIAMYPISTHEAGPE